jgi:hypothetical protein
VLGALLIELQDKDPVHLDRDYVAGPLKIVVPEVRRSASRWRRLAKVDRWKRGVRAYRKLSTSIRSASSVLSIE